MEQLVIVRPDGVGRYIAQAVALPEVKAAADTAAGAVEQVRQELTTWLASAELIRVEVPINSTRNPWLESFGRSANDPQFADYLEELQRARAADETP